MIVRASVPSDEHNRVLEIVADGEYFYRSTQVPLDGEHAPRTTVIEFRDLPSGEYEVIATVLREGGTRLRSVQHNVQVLRSGGAD